MSIANVERLIVAEYDKRGRISSTLKVKHRNVDLDRLQIFRDLEADTGIAFVEDFLNRKDRAISLKIAGFEHGYKSMTMCIDSVDIPEGMGAVEVTLATFDDVVRNCLDQMGGGFTSDEEKAYAKAFDVGTATVFSDIEARRTRVFNCD